MKVRQISLLTVIVLVFTVMLAACGGGGGSGGGGGTSSGRTINVDATEFAFNPNAFTGKVGEKITFKVTNKGTVDHNFVVLMPDGSKELANMTVKVGTTNSLDFTPSAAGDYVIECNIAGHKEAGMVGRLSVK
jgi:uncharacterized cupredoxin-like copper-binding protein